MNVGRRMKQAIRLLTHEMVQTLRNPGRVFRFLDPNARTLLRLRLKGVGYDLVPQKGGVNRRNYGSYEAYLAHQRSKLDMLRSGSRYGVDGTNLDVYDNDFQRELSLRLRELLGPGDGGPVLCLAARLGTEVKAFHELGYFAVGIDLNPGKDNPYVLQGDFHHLIFPDRSVSVVYTNSIDHAFDLKLLLAEVFRVLRPGGRLIAEVQAPADESGRDNTGFWESLSWKDTEDLKITFEAAGLQLDRELPFDFPWPGSALAFSKQVPAALVKNR